MGSSYPAVQVYVSGSTEVMDITLTFGDTQSDPLELNCQFTEVADGGTIDETSASHHP